uniref:Uncharacterized protein n=1 Tax=viral metagenome TaxID=1070528 RepID=A0A6M3JFT0_9ZZZZ
MSKQSNYEWSKEREYQELLADAEYETFLAELDEEGRADHERWLEEAAGY